MNPGLKIVQAYAAASGTSLHTLVGARVYRDYFGAADTFTNTQAAILVQQSSISTGINEHTGIYTFKCYGGTNNPDDAETVFRALHARFSNITGNTTSGGILFSQFSSGSPSVDPETGWPVFIATFQITTN